MKLKDKKVWLELYEVAEKIQKLEPWKYLWDTDLLMYLKEIADKAQIKLTVRPKLKAIHEFYNSLDRMM